MDLPAMSLLTSAEDVQLACQKLLASPGNIIAIDCEGKHLGRSGDISIIQAATPEEVFIFDVHASQGAVLNDGLKEILESSAIVKLFFDCRHDADALQHLHKVRLSGVCDLQLLDVMSRKDNKEEQLERLHKCLHSGNVEGSPHLYKNVIKLSGLNSCLAALGLDSLELKEHVRAKFRLDNDFWFKRPLPPDAVKYAADDVQSLFALLDGLAAARSEDAMMLVHNPTLREASDRYVDIFRCRDTLDELVYIEHALLPLCVIEGIPDVPLHGPTMMCKNCKRRIPREVFAKIAQKDPSKRRCDVCRAIDIDKSTRHNWERRNWDRDSDSDGPYYVRYDGPDDPDRYLGGGEFDHDDGYMCY